MIGQKRTFDWDDVQESDIVLRRYTIFEEMGKVVRVEGDSVFVKWCKQVGEHDYIWLDEERVLKREVDVIGTKDHPVRRMCLWSSKQQSDQITRLVALFLNHQGDLQDANR